MGRTEMSKRELSRVEVLARVKSSPLRVADAALLMRVSYRQAKRLWKQYREEGAAGLKHRSAGQCSNRASAESFRRKVLGLVREKYGGAVGERFGPSLAARAQRGEGAAFTALFDAYNRRVYGFCLRMTGSPQDAEKLIEEAFLGVFRKISTFCSESAFSTRLQRLAVKVVLMHLRKKRVHEVPLARNKELWLMATAVDEVNSAAVDQVIAEPVTPAPVSASRSLRARRYPRITIALAPARIVPSPTELRGMASRGKGLLESRLRKRLASNPYHWTNSHATNTPHRASFHWIRKSSRRCDRNGRWIDGSLCSGCRSVGRR